MNDHGFSLALEFDTDHPEFARGVEAGRLWEQLKSGEAVQQTIHATNAEMAIRMCEALDRAFRAETLDATWIELYVDAVPEDHRTRTQGDAWASAGYWDGRRRGCRVVDGRAPHRHLLRVSAG